MLVLRWFLFLVYPHAVGGTECLVGCMVQGIDPFDDDDLAVWDDRGACDATTVRCTVDARSYPSTTFQGALWASTSGTDGSSSCTCDICDPFPYGGTSNYMEDEASLWNRIQCYIAAAEWAGYDVTPCVEAILNGDSLASVDDVYEAPTVPQFECEDNGMVEHLSYTVEMCILSGTTHEAQELFPPSSSSTSADSGAVADTQTCLVGCMVQGIDPFDVDQAIWDSRGACDSATIGCEVTTTIYPSYSFEGALWVSSSGADGSSGCMCSRCDPFSRGGATDYMRDESLWSRIQCPLAASESSGYDVSPCVAVILDTGMLPYEDDVYEAPTVDLLQCEENNIADLDDSSSVEECAWTGDVHITDELFEGTTLVLSPLPDPTPSPLPNPTPSPLPLPAPAQTPLPSPTKAPAPAPTISGPTTAPTSITRVPTSIPEDTRQPSTASPETPRPTPVMPSVTIQPSPTSTVSPEPTPVAPPGTSPPSGLAPPIEIGGEESCAPGSTCSGNLCCHPEYNTCGRKYTYCQQGEFLGEARCCSGANGDTSELNLCSEDSIYDKPTGSSGDERLELWISIVGGLLAIFIAMWHGCKKCTGNRNWAAMAWIQKYRGGDSVSVS